MPKSGTTEVFDIIHALTKSEKAYFKSFSDKGNRSDTPLYLKLFSIIEKQKNYDEKKIVRTVKGLSPTRLAVLKNYLYEMILSSISAQHSETDIDSKLNQMIFKAEILLQKELFGQAKKIITKAKKNSANLLNYYALMNVIELERKLLLEKNYSGVSVIALHNLFLEKSIVIDNIQNIDSFIEIEMALFIKYFEFSKMVRTIKQKNQLDELMKNKLLSSESNAINLKGKLIFNNIHYLFHHLKENYRMSLRYARRRLEIVKSKPELIQHLPYHYLGMLSNLGISLNKLKMFSEEYIVIREMRSIIKDYKIKPTAKLNSTVFIKSYNLELGIIMDSGEYERIRDIIDNINEGLNKYKIIDADFIKILLHNVADIYFCLRDFRESLKWYNKAQQHMKFKDGQNTVGLYKIISLMVHFEMGDTEYLNYATRNTHRFLLKRKSAYKTELLLIEFFRKLPKLQNDKEIVAMLVQLKEKLLPIMSDPLEKRVFQLFDFICWVDSKIKNRSFAEMVRERK